MKFGKLNINNKETHQSTTIKNQTSPADLKLERWVTFIKTEKNNVTFIYTWCLREEKEQKWNINTYLKSLNVKCHKLEVSIVGACWMRWTAAYQSLFKWITSSSSMHCSYVWSWSWVKKHPWTSQRQNYQAAVGMIGTQLSKPVCGCYWGVSCCIPCGPQEGLPLQLLLLDSHPVEESKIFSSARSHKETSRTFRISINQRWLLHQSKTNRCEFKC